MLEAVHGYVWLNHSNIHHNTHERNDVFEILDIERGKGIQQKAKKHMSSVRFELTTFGCVLDIPVVNHRVM